MWELRRATDDRIKCYLYNDIIIIIIIIIRFFFFLK